MIYLSRLSGLWLRESGELKHNHISHGTILRQGDSSTLIRRTDYLLQKINYDHTSKTRINLKGGMTNSVSRERDISVPTNGSKTDTDTHSGIFSDDVGISAGFPKTCTVFQTGIYAINMTAKKVDKCAVIGL